MCCNIVHHPILRLYSCYLHILHGEYFISILLRISFLFLIEYDILANVLLLEGCLTMLLKVWELCLANEEINIRG